MDANILKYLRSNGEQLDADISKALNVPMVRLQPAFAQLAESGELICCKVTRFFYAKKIDGIISGLSCERPAPARGRKPGSAKNKTA